jgi:hypothetical protein
MTVRLSVWLAVALLPLLGPVAAAADTGGQGASFNVFNYTASASDCKFKAGAALGASGFQHIATGTGGDTTKYTGIFGDIGEYQAVVVCETSHNSVVFTVVGPDQKRTSELQQKFTAKFTE